MKFSRSCHGSVDASDNGVLGKVCKMKMLFSILFPTMIILRASAAGVDTIYSNAYSFGASLDYPTTYVILNNKYNGEILLSG